MGTNALDSEYELVSTLILLVVVVTSLFVIAAIQKSIFNSVMLFWISVVISAIITGAISRFIPLIPTDFAQLIISLVFITCTFLVLKFGTKLQAWNKAELVLLGISILCITILIIARLISNQHLSKIFSGAGRLAVAEDNGKWLNFSSHLSVMGPLNFQDGTSGALAIFLIIVAAACRGFAVLILGGQNLPGETIQTVVGAHNALIFFASLSILPAATYLFPESNRLTPKEIAKEIVNYFGIVVSAIFMLLAVSSASTFGHLSLEIVMVILGLWAASTIYFWQNSLIVGISGFLASWVALIWLPLPPFSLVVASSTLVIILWRIRKSLLRPRSALAVSLLLANVFCVYWLTTPEVEYLSSSTSNATSIHLVIAEGSTMVAGRIEYLVILILLIVVFISGVEGIKKKNWSYLFSFFPVFLLLGFALFVNLYDLKISPEGWPHYGSRKLTYAFVAICIAVLIPICFKQIGNFKTRKSWAQISLIVFITLLVLSSGTARSGIQSFLPATWYRFDIRPEADGPTWLDISNPANSVIPSFDGYPLMCVAEDNGRIAIGDMDSYFCSRFLISINGLESSNMNLITMIQSPLDKSSIELLSATSKGLQKKPVLVINSDGEVTRTISLQDLMQWKLQQVQD